MSRVWGGLCTLFLIILFSPAITRADTIVITSGTFMFSGVAGGPVFDFAGNNFSATGAGGDSGNTDLQRRCFACIAGQSIGVGGSFIGSQLGGGSATLNGVLFPSIGFGGSFGIGGTSFIVPSVLTNVTITVPFTFVATLNGCPGGCLTNPAVFSVDLVGSGTATVMLTFAGLDNFGNPFFTFQKATFQFEVPEPASILLFAGGLGLLTAKLRRRRSAQNDNSA
jgi:hypothetical protein